MKHTCAVCKRPIQANAVDLGKGLYRHAVKCAPLTANWCRAFPRSESAKLMRLARKRERQKARLRR